MGKASLIDAGDGGADGSGGAGGAGGPAVYGGRRPTFTDASLADYVDGHPALG